ncbi:MAG: FecR family protein [Verrucomicrobiota bacterium]|nr:FecR family protein [Verrucomicrobiota bacterium]
MHNLKNTELDKLLAKLVDDSITDEELASLEQILDGDVSAQRRYFHYLDLHMDLQERVTRSKIHPKIRFGLSKWKVAGIAAMFCLWIGLSYFAVNEGSGSGPAAFARITGMDGLIEWSAQDGSIINDLSVGDPLSEGIIEGLTSNSWVEIELDDGSEAVISGISKLKFSQDQGSKVLRLSQGYLSVNATPQLEDKPMLVFSPGARAEVLGTQFNVVASPESTRYTVNEGLVRVKRINDGSVQEVSANHYVVAGLDSEDEFKSVLLEDYSEEWKSEFPRDVRRGHLYQSDKITAINPVINPAVKLLTRFSSSAQRVLAPYRLRTKPCLWFEKGRKPELHFSVNIGVSATGPLPVRINEDAKFKVRGRIDRNMFGVDNSNSFIVGFTSNHAHGGFAGKYVTKEKVNLSSKDKNDQFEIEIPVSEFLKVKKGELKDSLVRGSSAGLELLDIWFVTYQNIGLEIFDVEIILKDE